MVGIGILGAAHIHTPNFAQRLRNRDSVRVAAVWDHDSERAQRYATMFGAQLASTPYQVLTNPEVEAVVICSETSRHAELVLEALGARKHLFVEKPLAARAEEAFELATAIERAGVKFQTGYFMRSHPINRFLKQEIAQGRFGRITRVRTSNGHAGALLGWFDTEWRWMADLNEAGVGGFGDLGSHALDLTLWLLEGDFVRSATAYIGNATGRYGETDEFGEGLLEFSSGAAGTVAASWVDLDNPAQLVISGTKAHAVVVNGELYYKCEEIAGADGRTPWADLPEPLPHAFELFLDALEGQEVPLVTPREAARVVAVMDAMYEGSARKAWVTPRWD